MIPDTRSTYGAIPPYDPTAKITVFLWDAPQPTLRHADYRT
jgi:hypothetical protein